MDNLRNHLNILKNWQLDFLLHGKHFLLPLIYVLVLSSFILQIQKHGKQSICNLEKISWYRNDSFFFSFSQHGCHFSSSFVHSLLDFLPRENNSLIVIWHIAFKYLISSNLPNVPVKLFWAFWEERKLHLRESRWLDGDHAENCGNGV